MFAQLSVQAQIKENIKLRVTGLGAGNSPVTGEFPVQKASNAENVSIWWRHHGWRPAAATMISIPRRSWERNQVVRMKAVYVGKNVPDKLKLFVYKYRGMIIIWLSAALIFYNLRGYKVWSADGGTAAVGWATVN